MQIVQYKSRETILGGCHCLRLLCSSRSRIIINDSRHLHCRSQESVWFCRKSFYHRSIVATPSSSPPSRHGNLNVCVCVSVWENKGGWMWLEQILITTAQLTHSLQLCILTVFSCPSAFNFLHSCDVVTGAFWWWTLTFRNHFLLHSSSCSPSLSLSLSKYGLAPFLAVKHGDSYHILVMIMGSC